MSLDEVGIHICQRQSPPFPEGASGCGRVVNKHEANLSESNAVAAKIQLKAKFVLCSMALALEVTADIGLHEYKQKLRGSKRVPT